MNQPDSEAAPLESAPTPALYKDCSGGLTVFGILTILFGCVAGLFCLLMLAQAATSEAMRAQVGLQGILPGVFMYGGLGVALVWLGIGSIMARRWARALLLIFSWLCLITGVAGLLFMVFFMPQMLANMSAGGAAGQPGLSPRLQAVVMAVVCLMFGVFLIIVPAVWIFFYGNRDVKATCEMRDPVTRWTDSCPLPVLALALLFMISAPFMLVIPLMGHGVMPFFGGFLTGIPGAMYCLILGALWGYAAWLLYKLEPRGWWLILIVMCVLMASGLLTFARHDMLEMYRLMGYPEAQIEQIQRSGLFVKNQMTWMMALSMLPFLGYLLFIKKYFRRSAV
jgi:hypothetical protein